MLKVGSCWSGWCRSGVGVGVGVGVGWRRSGWVGLVRASQGGEDLWFGWGGWLGGGGLECG